MVLADGGTGGCNRLLHRAWLCAQQGQASDLARRLHSKLKSPVHTDFLQQSKPKEMLSGREKEVLKLIAADNTSTEIGARLGISGQTVNTHIKNMYRKLNVRRP